MQKQNDANDMIVYLQDNQFMGLVESEGAKEIKGSAKDAGFIVEDYGCFFNVVYKTIKEMAKDEVIQYG